MQFDELADLNPRESLKKGDVYPFVDMASLPSDARDFSFSELKAFKGSGSKFRDGDTLIARITPCLENGKGGFVSGLGDGVRGFGSTEFIVARPKDPRDALFIYYLSRSDDFRQIAISRMEGTSGRQRVPWQQVASIDAPRLEPSERRSIASILGALDDKIENNRKTAATLEEMARALYRSWFVDFDPVHAKAAGDKPAFMDEETAALFPDRFGDDGLPEGWEVRSIGSVGEIVGGGTPSKKDPAFWQNGHHLWATPRDLAQQKWPVIFETENCVTDAGLSKISSRLSPPGTVLLSSRAPIGYLAIAAEPISFNQGFIGIRETEAISGPEAYFWCLENMEIILANSNGSTFQEISKKAFKPIRYLLAPYPVRQSFYDYAGIIFRKITSLNRENRSLATLRDTLLPKLISGEIRVGEAREQVEEVT